MKPEGVNLMAKKNEEQVLKNIVYVTKDGEAVAIEEFKNRDMVQYNMMLSPSSCIGVYVADCETYKNNVVGVNKTSVWAIATTNVIWPYNYTKVNTITDYNNTDCIGEWFNFILARKGADYLIKLNEDKDYSIYMVDDDTVYINFITIPDNMLKHIYTVGNCIYLHMNVINVYFHNLDFDGNFIGSYIEANAEKLGLTKEYTVTTEFYTKQNTYSMLYNKDASNFIYLAIKGEENTVLFIKDSANLISGSLREIANDFDTQYKKLDMDYDEHRPGEEVTEAMRQYIAHDVLSLAEIMYNLLTNGMTQLTATGFAVSKLKEHIGQKTFYQLFPNQYNEWLLKDEKGYIFPLKEDGTLNEDAIFDNISDNIQTADAFVRESYKGGLVLLRDNKIKRCVTDDDVYPQNKLFDGLQEVRTGKGVALDCTSMYPYRLHSKSGTYFPIKQPIYLYSKNELNYTYNELYDILKYEKRIVSKCDVINYINNAKYFRHLVSLLKSLNLDNPATNREEAAMTLSLNMGRVSNKEVPLNYEYINVYRFIKFRCSFRLKDDGIPSIMVSSIGSQATSFLRCNKTISSLGDVVELTLSQTDFELFVENYNIFNFEALQMIEYEAKIGLFDSFVDRYFSAKQNSKGVHRALNKSILNNCTGRMGRKKLVGVAIPYIDEKGRLSFKVDDTLMAEEVHAYVPVASALLSSARKCLIYGIKNIFPTTFNYSDTDSLKVEESLESVEKKINADELYTLGTNLGDWKNDLGDGVEFAEAIYLKLKTYTCKADGKYHITAAGISRKATHIMEEYFSLSDELKQIDDKEEYMAKIKNTISQLNLTDDEREWFNKQIFDDMQLKIDEYESGISVGIQKFSEGYELPPQLKAVRVENGVILEYRPQKL